MLFRSWLPVGLGSGQVPGKLGAQDSLRLGPQEVQRPPGRGGREAAGPQLLAFSPGKEQAAGVWETCLAPGWPQLRSGLPYGPRSQASLQKAHKGGVICISAVIDISPGNLDSSCASSSPVFAAPMGVFSRCTTRISGSLWCGASIRFLTRYNGELRDPLVWC